MIAIYARQSVERENSISIETQIEYCKCTIKPDERNQKIKIYEDKGVSGKDIYRNGFQELLQDIKTGKISKIIVYKLDRISRSLNDFVGILQTFKDNNVEFVSSQESFDTSSPYGELIVNILMIFAEFERTSIINRITDAYKSRSDMGIYMGGRIPYAFKLSDEQIGNRKTKKYIIIPEQAEHIHYIYEMYSQEGMSLDKLVKVFVNNNIRPFQGVAWTGAKLSSIMKNPIYVKTDADIYSYFMKKGTQILNNIKEYKGINGAKLYGYSKHDTKSNDWSDMKLVLMTHEGIVDSRLWLKCQKKLERNNQIRRAVINKNTWLSGIMFCVNCGHMVKVTKNKVGTRYFTCSGKQNKKICQGFSTTYADEFENMISSCIKERLVSLNSHRTRVNNEISPKINSLKLKIKEVELLESKIIDELISSDYDAEMINIANSKARELKNRKIKLYDEIDVLSNEQDTIKSSLNLKKRWQKANFEEKKAIANILINKVNINTDGSSEIIWNI